MNNTGANKRVKISNSITLAATDVVVANGNTTITGLDAFPTAGKQSLRVRPNLVGTPQVAVATITVVASSSYELDVQGAINGVISIRRFQYDTTSASVATNTAAMAAAFTAWAAIQGFDGTVVVTSSTSPTIVITGTGDSTTILMNLIGVTGAVITSGMATYTLESHANVNATAIIFKVTGHGLITGNVVKVPTLTGQTAANGVAARVIRVDADTFNLANISTNVTYKASGTGSAQVGGVLTLVAQPAFGTIANVNADAAANGSTDTATQTTYNYDCVEIVADYAASVSPASEDREVLATLWFPAQLIETPFTVVNAAFEAALVAIEV